MRLYCSRKSQGNCFYYNRTTWSVLFLTYYGYFVFVVWCGVKEKWASAVLWWRTVYWRSVHFVQPGLFYCCCCFFFLPHILSRLMSMFIISPCCSPHVNSWVISQTRSLSAPSRIINLMYSGVRCPRRWSVQPNVTPSRYGVERQKEQEGEKNPHESLSAAPHDK